MAKVRAHRKGINRSKGGKSKGSKRKLTRAELRARLNKKSKSALVNMIVRLYFSSRATVGYRFIERSLGLIKRVGAKTKSRVAKKVRNATKRKGRRTAKQRAATRKLVALNRRRRRSRR